VTDWPDPNASRDEVEAFVEKKNPSFVPEHEAPEIEGGPSIVCNACGLVRVSMLSPFCKGCLSMLAAGGAL
jgi:hypothetical protein